MRANDNDFVRMLAAFDLAHYILSPECRTELVADVQPYPWSLSHREKSGHQSHILACERNRWERCYPGIEINRRRIKHGVLFVRSDHQRNRAGRLNFLCDARRAVEVIDNFIQGSSRRN